MGVVRVWNPEYPAHNSPLSSQCATSEGLLATIERHLGVAISFPNPYPKEIGLKTSRGVASYRAVQALYQAWRIKRLVSGLLRPCVLEIGGGLGRTAFYGSVLGIEDYTLVDIPLSAIAQGYFLGRCLGETAVELVGETAPATGPKIRFLTPKAFMESKEHYDLIVNVDSMTEVASDVAHGYLRKIAASTPLLLSINHEINSETVAGMLASVPTVSEAQRSPYWMRRGYVEEVFRFGPATAVL